MKNIDEILAMAQNVQSELEKAQANLDTIEVEGASGGGLVKVKASAKGRIIGIAIDDSGGLAIAARLRHGARIVSYAPPEFALSGSRPVSADTLAELGTLLKSVTRTAWKVSIVDAPGEPTLREAQDAADEAVKQAILESPIMKAAVAAFPDAQLESWPGQRSNA